MTVPYMGLSRVRVDTNRLRAQAQALYIIALDFTSGGNVVDNLTEAIGRNDQGSLILGRRVSQAADQWSATRHNMSEGIQKLQQYTELAAQSFDNLDQDMARAITPHESQPRPPGAPPRGAV